MSTSWERLANEPILDIAPYQPGKPIEEVERELDIAGAIKLASNENPFPPPPRVLQAILTVFPLDAASSPAVFAMQPSGHQEGVPPPVAEFQRALGANATIGSLDRFAFYERARNAFAVVRTGDLRPYGNAILVKGVVNEYPPK